MGYSTTFEGSIQIDPPLNNNEIQYLKNFSQTRHHQRKSGSYSIDLKDDIYHLQENDQDTINFNQKESDVPSLHCCWEPSDDGQYLNWNGIERCYYPKEWLEYLIENFLKNNSIAKQDNEGFSFLQSHTLNGVIEAQGEMEDDHYYLVVENNKVYISLEKKEILTKKNKKYNI